MFEKHTVLDVTNLPADIKQKARLAYWDNIDGSNESFIRVYPCEVLERPKDDDGGIYPLNEQKVMSWEKFQENYEDRDLYDFLVWCIEQGQRDEFILLYWW